MNQMKWAFALVLSVGMSLMGGGTYAAEPSARNSLDTSGSYIGGGVKGIFWGDKTFGADASSVDDMGDPLNDEDGNPLTSQDLKIEYDDALYYYFIWGSAWDSSFLRFRFDTEIYFGENDVKLTRGTETANGSIIGYGLNLNAYYDLPTFSRFTPYIGVSAMALGVELEFDNNGEADLLLSRRVDDYLGGGGGRTGGDTDGFNLLYGFGFTGGLRWEIASALALGASYRIVRLSDCVVNRGCDLLLQKTAHEARAELLLRF